MFALDPSYAERAVLAYVYGLNGRKKEADLLAAELKQPSDKLPVGQFYFCYIPMGLKQYDEAVQCLEQANQRHPGVLSDLESEPIFDPLRQTLSGSVEARRQCDKAEIAAVSPAIQLNR